VTPQPLRLRVLLERLREAEVDFVLVGGLAVNAWGYLRATRDVDLVPDPSPENLARLDALLVELGGKVEVGERLLESSAIKTFLRTGDRTLVLTDLGRIDVLQGLPQIPASPLWTTGRARSRWTASSSRSVPWTTFWR
jgi:hypothetical protein